MKRKTLMFIFIMTMATGGVIFARFSAFAKTNIKSKENFVMDNGNVKVAIYANDIDYLQSELNDLFNELPQSESLNNQSD